MHFLVEPQTLERLWDRRLFLAEQDGEVVGFLVVDPITSRRGFLVEQIVQAWAAPNGTAELLVDAAFAAAMKQGLEYFTLGLSPLSLAILEKNDQPFWLDFLFHWVRIHGSRFYNFQGLEHFKSKFAPDYWEPIHAISNQPSFTAGNLLAIAAVFGGGSPFKFLALALGRALRQEYQWFYNRIRGKKWEI